MCGILKICIDMFQTMYTLREITIETLDTSFFVSKAKFVT
jgi:hypothetical protein